MLRKSPVLAATYVKPELTTGVPVAYLCVKEYSI